MNIDQLVKTYKPTQESVDILNKSKIVFLAGIMSAGKNTLKDKLLDFSGYYSIITHTTRPKRINNGTIEQDGVEYHFVSIEQVEKLLTDNKMVEINRFGNNYYGSSIDEFVNANNQNLTSLMSIDVNGVESIRRLTDENVMSFFVVPPDCEVWIDRIKKRYGSLDSFNIEWQNRREITIHELSKALKTPYYKFVVNGDLDSTATLVDKIIKGDKNDYDDKKARDIAEDLLRVIRQFY